ncbi:hypothetical protein V6C27_01285 [Peptococcaceae bacterium 1198_IL3148]
MGENLAVMLLAVEELAEEMVGADAMVIMETAGGLQIENSNIFARRKH